MDDLMYRGPDPELESHWRALPTWQRWALIHVVDGVTLTTWLEEATDFRPTTFHILAKRRPGGDTWECEIHVSVLEEAHDVDYLVITVLRDMRPDFFLLESEREAAATRRLRAMAHQITPTSTPAVAELAWLTPRARL